MTYIPKIGDRVKIEYFKYFFGNCTGIVTYVNPFSDSEKADIRVKLDGGSDKYFWFSPLYDGWRDNSDYLVAEITKIEEAM